MLNNKKIYTISFIAIFLLTLFPLNEFNKTAYEESELNLPSSDETPMMASIDDIEGLCMYVIITNELLKNSNEAYTFQDLVESKIENGVSATIVTVEEIRTRFDGRDDAERIRNFIVHAFRYWSTTYVLLGGDSNIIPVRYFVDLGTEAPPIGWEYDEQDYSWYTDQYYASVFNDWDHNNNGFYGEYADWQTLLSASDVAQVYVGRAPVGSVVEVSNFVKKTLRHEHHINSIYQYPYLSKCLMTGEFIGNNEASNLPYPLAVFGAQYLEQLYMYSSNEYCTDHGYQTKKIDDSFKVDTLYERDRYNPPFITLLDPSDVEFYTDSGIHILNHYGRPYQTFLDPPIEEENLFIGHDLMMKMDYDYVSEMDNYYPFFLYSAQGDAFSFANEVDQGKYPEFSTDSVGERFITAENGAFAALGKTYIMGLDKTTTDTAEQEFVREFYDAIFGEGIDEIGRALQDAKSDTRRGDNWDNWQYRQLFLSLQIFGDPMAVIKPRDNLFKRDRGPYDYVIITNENLQNSNREFTFQDFVDHKSNLGFSTKIITVEEIYSQYKYWDDNQEKIKTFIKDAYENWGTIYILLGGDENIVPVRHFEALEMISKYDDPIPSDQYYISLDYSWDHDNDGIYGEEEDWNNFFSIDTRFRVTIGRAPVENEQELSNFLRKTIFHDEKMRDDNDYFYLYSLLNVGEYMGIEYEEYDYTASDIYGAEFLDELIYDEEHLGICTNHNYNTVQFPQYFDIETLYERDFTWDAQHLLEIIERDQGVHIINHKGHGTPTENMKLRSENIDALNNDKYYFIYSTACRASDLDEEDSIGEHWVNSEHGAFAYLGNYKYGWTCDPVDPNTDGIGDCYRREFYDALLGERRPDIGNALQDAKIDALDHGKVSSDLIYYQYQYLSLNLLGDPTARIIPYGYLPDITSYDSQINIALDNINLGENNVSFSYDISSYIFNKGSADITDEFLIHYTARNIHSGYIHDLGEISIGYLEHLEGDYVNCRGTITLPFGEYQILQRLDRFNRVYERDELNNNQMRTELLILDLDHLMPDLRSSYTNIEFSDPILGEDIITFSYDLSSDITNDGYVGTTEEIYVRFTAKNLINGEVYELGLCSISGMNPNEMKTIRCSGTITLPVGDYEINSVVDSNANINEVDDDNNNYVNPDPLEITYDTFLPDIEGDCDAFLFEITDAFFSKDNVLFSYDLSAYVRNSGFETQEGFYINYTARNLETREIYDLGECFVNGLDSLHSEFAQCSGTISLPRGQYELMYYVDCYNHIDEKNENNNRYGNYENLDLPGDTYAPDLCCIGWIQDDLSDFVFNEDGITFTYRISNSVYNYEYGTSEEFYVLFTAVNGTDVYELGKCYVDGLGKHESKNVECTGRITLPYGDYEIRQYTDFTDEVFELNENNNLGSKPLFINEYSPDFFISSDIEYKLSNEEYYAYNITFDYEFSFNISNSGYIYTSGFYVRFIAINNNNETHDLGDCFISGGFNTEEERSVVCKGTATLPFDEYQIICFVDTYGQVIETNEDNNIYINPEPFLEELIQRSYCREIYYEEEYLRVIWSANSSIPDRWEVYVDGLLQDSGKWYSGQPIIVDLVYDLAPPGIYRIEILFYELNGHSLRSSVLVSVGPQPYVLGDVNNDGFIDCIDALKIAQYYVGIEYYPFYPELADVNADGSIDIIDALLVAQYYVGLIDSFPAED